MSRPRIPFDAIFAASPNAYMLVDRDLRYVAANAAYLASTHSKLEDLIGRRVTDVFPHDPSNPANEVARRLTDSLRRVVETGRPDVLALIPYRILTMHDGVSRYEDHDWSATHTPIFDEQGRVEFVLQHTVDVTELRDRGERAAADPAKAAGVLARAETVEAQKAALDSSLSELRRIFDQSPGFMCFLRGQEFVFELANVAYMQLVGHRDVIGKPIAEALPEVRAQGFVDLLEQVVKSGEAFVGRGMLVKLQRTVGAELEDRFVDFVYQPAIAPDGRCVGVIVHGVDITQQTLAEEAIRQALAESRAARAELEALFESFPEALYVSDGRSITRANRAALDLLGLDTPDQLQLSLATIAKALHVRDRNGTPLAPDEMPAARAARGERVEMEAIVHHAKFDEDRLVRSAAAPIRVGDRITGSVITHTDMTTRFRAEEEMRASRAQAEAANRTKDEFLATVSHELRTPLTSMLGWVRMLRTGMLSEEKRANALETVERNARAQAQLIEDLLDVSRIVSGKLELDVEPVDATSVVSGAVETIRPTADAKRIQLEVAMDATGVLLGDSHRLQQVVWNLLANAVKFTPAGGRVTVRANRLGDVIEFAIEDTGCGIASDFLPHVFERFRQGDGGSARRAGLGLGLSIARHIVEAHGGTIRAESDGEGKGARFVFRLPLIGPTTRWHADAPAHEGDDWRESHALAGLHVLVVDDEADTREYLRSVLEQCGVRVTDASSAEGALRSFRADRPNVIVSDIGMPGGDGYSLIASIRSLTPADGGKTPAVALTAYAQPADRSRALRSGFQNHVTKPVEPGELVAVVASLVR